MVGTGEENVSSSLKQTFEKLEFRCFSFIVI